MYVTAHYMLSDVMNLSVSLVSELICSLLLQDLFHWSPVRYPGGSTLH